jgi:hypothetical protein
VRLVVALLLVGCQQSNPQPSTGSGSGSQPAPIPAAKPVTKPKSTLDLALPPSSGKPPKKTTAPMSQAIADKLVALRFPDFTIEMTPYPDSIAIRQRANARPRMSVNIAVGRCGAVNACRPMEVAAWRADKATLMQTVDPQLRDRPDSVFEIDSASINGAPAISVYQAGQFFGTDEAGNPVGSFSHALTLHYNDGVNFLRVTASFSDNARDSIADMQAALPRPFLERVTAAFLDAYGQAWTD